MNPALSLKSIKEAAAEADFAVEYKGPGTWRGGLRYSIVDTRTRGHRVVGTFSVGTATLDISFTSRGRAARVAKFLEAIK